VALSTPTASQANSQVELDDHYLVALAKDGRTDAYDMIIRRYRGFVRLKASSYFLLGGESDDLIQEGLLGLYKAIRDYRSDRESSFRNFAELCITRQIITAVKTATRQKHLPLNACVSLHETAVADADAENTLLDCLPDTRLNDPQDCLLRQRETHGRLEEARHILSPLESQVLDCYLQGKSYREMSAELRCPPKAVDNALQRVKRKIGDTFLD